MTIAELAAVLRGMPQQARLLIDTPDGLRELRCVKGIYARVAAGGQIQTTVSMVGDYAIVLYHEGRSP